MDGLPFTPLWHTEYGVLSDANIEAAAAAFRIVLQRLRGRQAVNIAINGALINATNLGNGRSRPAIALQADITSTSYTQRLADDDRGHHPHPATPSQVPVRANLPHESQKYRILRAGAPQGYTDPSVRPPSGVHASRFENDERSFAAERSFPGGHGVGVQWVPLVLPSGSGTTSRRGAISEPGAISGPGGSSSECFICGSEEEDQKNVRVSCGHTLCQECLNASVKAGTQNKMSFPPRCCNINGYDVSAILEQLDEPVKARYLEIQEEYSTLVPLWCSKKACSKMFSKEYIDGASGKFLTCMHCGFETCKNCKQGRPTHRWGKMCPEDNGMSAADLGLMENKRWKSCPVCSLLIERMDGCDHMRCPQCKTEFCYSCGGKKRAGPFSCACSSAPTPSPDPSILETFRKFGPLQSAYPDIPSHPIIRATNGVSRVQEAQHTYSGVKESKLKMDDHEIIGAEKDTSEHNAVAKAYSKDMMKLAESRSEVEGDGNDKEPMEERPEFNGARGRGIRWGSGRGGALRYRGRAGKGGRRQGHGSTDPALTTVLRGATLRE